MPELPEVETIKRDLAQKIIGSKIISIKTSSLKQIKPSLAIFRPKVVGQKIIKVKRRAKLLQIFLSNEYVILVHLKMSGQILIREKGQPKDKYQRVVVNLSGNQELRFTDLRKFGWLKLIKKEELEKILQKYGPEPLDDLTLERFGEILSSTKKRIKGLLMDQEKISGIGNIYANEALFLAQIDPQKPANKITPGETKKLHKAIEKVLRKGIKYRGASDQDYLDTAGEEGHYQDHFLVYGREGKNCLNCKGKVKKIALGGRGTYFCPQCQK